MLFEVVLDVKRWMDRGHELLLVEGVDDMNEGVDAEPDERDQDEDRDGSLSRHGLLLTG
jgi:hypothetical protein